MKPSELLALNELKVSLREAAKEIIKKKGLTFPNLYGKLELSFRNGELKGTRLEITEQ